MSGTKRRRRRESRGELRSSRALYVALGLLGVTVVGAPLLLGGVPAWARVTIQLASWLSLVAAMWATRRSLHHKRLGAWLFLGCGLVAMTGLQLLPLPLSWVRWLAPESASGVVATYAALGFSEPGWAMLSMDSGSSLASMLQGLGLVSAACAAWLLAGEGRRRSILWLVAASAGVMAFVALGHEAAGLDQVFGVYEPRYVHPHPLSPLLNLNHLAALLSVGAVVSMGLAADLRGGQRTATLALSIALVATTLLTVSRGGIASMIGAIVLFVLLVRFESGRGKASARMGLALALGAGVSLGVYLALEPLLAQLGEGSVDSKLEVAQQGLTLALQHPWFGVGRGAFGSASSQIWGTTGRALYAENLPAQWAAEWGIPVTLAALGVLGASVARLFRRRHSPPRLAASIALVMLFAHELVDFSLELAGVGTVAAVLFGATIGKPHRRSRSKSSESGAESPGQSREKVKRIGARPLLIALAVVSLIAFASLSARSVRLDSLSGQEALGALLQAGQPAQFQTRLVATMKAHPQDAAFPLLGGAEAVGRAAPEALPLLNRAMTLAPGWASPHELTARWLLRHGRRDQALLELREAAARDPRLAAPLMCRVLRFAPDAAVALRAAPTGADGVVMLNRAARCMSRHPEVAAAIDAEMLRRDGDAIDPRLRAIERLRRAHEVDAALLLARESLAEHPADAKLTLALAQVLVDADQGQEALNLLHTRAAGFNDREGVLRIEARAHAALGDAEGMHGAINRLRGLAAGRGPALAATLHEQARLELVLGNRAQALVALERAQEIRPRPATLMQIARLAEQLGATGRARRAYRDLLRRDPDNVAFQRALVRVGGQLPRH